VLKQLCTGEIAVEPNGTTFSAPIRSGNRVVPGVIRALDDAGVDVLDVEVTRPTLDDVFLTLTGRTASDEPGEVA
jgi:ABC-2 type transport system ATP-binding protein